ncbi:TetR family transcriptional regulator [Streptomyces sp. Amel2xB2]|uniref:TetR/AcrR family transcriptional regulator n=1 Tax=Streptomyces TaxID=1883 RepID=UPI000B271340|nr:TetR family transcriptional regulator [Streptomyces sp. Amel2xB2]RAJ71271.1 TetR family transcriptional regulator [Streptomyces sp. Amel2xB2]
MKTSTPKPGRPARLSREQIVETALGCDLRTMTMRDLAERLGVSHSALYRWVRDRDQLLDLVSEVVVERILPEAEPTAGTWRQWLTDLAWGMHDQFLAVPGYAAHLATPHRHHAESFGRLRDRVVTAFELAGASRELAEQSWHIFGLGVVQWLGARQTGHDVGVDGPRFDLFLGVLLRGLPAREDAEE